MNYTRKQLEGRKFTKAIINEVAIKLFGEPLKTSTGKNKSVLIDEFLKRQEDKNNLTPPVDTDLTGYDRYYVRYIGIDGSLDHGPNSTISGKHYLFSKGSWVEVDKIDFDRKYHPKVKKAIQAKKQPHFELSRKNTDGHTIILYNEYMIALGDRKIIQIGDFTGITEFHLIELGSAQVRSLRDFMGVPDEWLLRSLKGLNLQLLATWRDEAQRGIVDDREVIRKRLEIASKGEQL